MSRRRRYVALIVGIMAFVTTGAGTTATATPATVAALPPGGVWVASSPGTAPRADSGLVPPRRMSCPAGTSSYPSPNEEYSCVSVYADNGNTGHQVGIRTGGPNSFGLQKAITKHGLTERTLAYVIVNNANGVLQPSTGRYLYGLRYEINGDTIVSVEVYEQREPSGVFNDGYALGVVTAFCPGYQGRCPDGVNESIG